LSAFGQDNVYVDKLVREASRIKLDEERGWTTLLHYGKTFSGNYKSKIDDEKFFLSQDGRINPKAELEATLRSFFQTNSDNEQNNICKFPARLAWLSERLQIGSAQLPAVSCSERDKLFGAIDAKSAVLVFPVGHINSPASMFGHTLIRIDSSSKSNLISYAVNYSASNTDSSGLTYAWKGLTGMYKGYYSLMPYYDKVREYNNLEHRDMWEYKLNLTSTEVKRMLEHIWELQNIESSYYFLDENCSYNLLFLIEVARPELHLTDKAGIFVVPSDTVRTVMNSGVIEEVNYRASQGTKIRKIISLLDQSELNLAHDISYQKKNPAEVKELPVSNTERIKILDLSASFVQFRFSRKEMEKEVYSRLYLKILNERSALGAAPDKLYEIQEPSSPDAGHGSTRVSIATGLNRKELFGEVNIRPEFHALLDPDQGYIPGAQIKFFDTTVRYGVDTSHIYLKSLHLIDIISISPRDTFFKPFSWKVNTGFDREMLRDGQEHVIYRLNTGGGLSYSSPFGGIWYALGEIDVNAGPKFRAFATAAPGLNMGVTEQLFSNTKLLLNIAGYCYVIGDDRYSTKATLGINQRITQNNSLSVETSHEYTSSKLISETLFRWNFYY
jgi:hypothetical protein